MEATISRFAAMVRLFKASIKRLQTKREDDIMDGFHSFIRKRPAFALISEFVASAFAREVASGHEEEYKISIVLAELLAGLNVSNAVDRFRHAGAKLGDSKLAGILYPTLAMDGNADNAIFYPEMVDRHLRLSRLEWAEIIEWTEPLKMKLGIHDVADQFAPDGTILWNRTMPSSMPVKQS